jgi:hypothetical protein
VHNVCEIFPEVSKVTLALFYALGLREMEKHARQARQTPAASNEWARALHVFPGQT